MSFKKNSLEDFILDTKLNSSDRKRIRAYVMAQYPGIVPYINDIWPKNEDSVHYVSVRNSDAKAQIVAIKGSCHFLLTFFIFAIINWCGIFLLLGDTSLF